MRARGVQAGERRSLDQLAQFRLRRRRWQRVRRDAELRALREARDKAQSVH